MFAKRMPAVVAMSAAALAVCALAAPVQTTTVLRRGVGHGNWDLPLAQNGQGSADGIFFIPNVPNSQLHFVATLTDVPSACLSCIEGTLDGTLDDGIGPGPDYVVRGHYLGSFFGGNGQWTATIFPAGAPQTTPVGRIRGMFDDPPSNAGPGSFACRWMIND